MEKSNALDNALSGSTGTGAFVGTDSPEFITPNLGTPASGNLINCTGFSLGNFSFIDSQTADNDSEIVFDGFGSFSTYMIFISGLTFSGNNKSLFLQTSSDGGDNWDDGVSDYNYNTRTISNNAITNIIDSGDTHIILSNNMIDNSIPYFGIINGFQEPSSYFYVNINTFAEYHANGGYFFGGGSRISTSTVNALRLYMDAGNIVEGTFLLYGLTTGA